MIKRGLSIRLKLYWQEDLSNKAIATFKQTIIYAPQTHSHPLKTMNKKYPDSKIENQPNPKIKTNNKR